MPGVADVVREFGPAYRARYGAAMPPSHRRALGDLATCRTAALGGHVSRCDRCGTEHYVYHSCRSRSCPTCHGTATTAWLTAREGELLPVPYFHVVFTLPSEIRDLVRTHQRRLLALLMTTAANCLQTLAADPHYVGGTLGILAVLHTWTRALVYHPHVHCLVPAGAVAVDDQGGLTWRSARGDFLVPVRALSVLFRARFLAQVARALPDAQLPPAVWRKPWVVYCKPTVQGSSAVLRYLARYVHRVAITDARVLAIADGGVTFSYKDARAHRWRRMTLPAEEFLRRFLQHVLPRGFHKVRYYGFWQPAARATRALLQQTLAPPRTDARDDPMPPRGDAGPHAGPHAGPRSAPLNVRGRCPHCADGTLRIIRRLPPVATRRLNRHEGRRTRGLSVVLSEVRVARLARRLTPATPVASSVRIARGTYGPADVDPAPSLDPLDPTRHQADHQPIGGGRHGENSITAVVAPRGSVQRSLCVGCAPQKL